MKVIRIHETGDPDVIPLENIKHSAQRVSRVWSQATAASTPLDAGPIVGKVVLLV